MDETTKVIRIVIDSSKAVDGSAQATRALQQIEQQTKQTADSVLKMESGLDVAALVAKLTGAGYVIKEFADRILGVFKAARDAASGISDFAEQLGVSTNFVQASMYAAAQHTVDVEKLGIAYTKASEKIGQAAQGQKAAIDTFDAIGVKLLDGSGKLRSTETLLSDSAAALLKIEDPARRVALAMELFGKSGAQVIPMLKDLAAGSDVMMTKARDANAVIEKETIEALSKLKAHSEEASLKWNALIANMGTPIATAAMETVDKILGSILAKLREMDAQRRLADQGVLPDNEQKAVSDNYNRWREIAGRKENRNNAYIQSKFDRARQAFENMTAPAGSIDNIPDAAERAEILRQQNAAQILVSGSFPPTEPLEPPGVSNPADKAAGESIAQKIQKLKDTLTTAARAQDEMTAAAARGDTAFQQQQAHQEALTKALEVYDGKLKVTSPQVQALTKDIEGLILAQKEGAAAQAFLTKSTELQQENTLLEAQIRLISQAPEVQARELALLKEENEAKKAGAKLTDDQRVAMRDRIESNERLKLQLEELKKAEELWTAPLKQALQNIQTIGANAFEQLLQSGNLSFQSLAQTFTQTLRRMAAEFLALQFVRPVLSVAVAGLVGAGMASPAMASQLGFPQSIAGSASAGVPGGSGLSGLSDVLGSGGGWFSGVGDFLGRPIGSLFPSATPAGGFANVGDLLASGQTGASAAASGMGGLGGISIGQGLGAIGGFASGAMTLMGGDGSAGSTISGIGQMVGAAVSLIPGVGQIAGPLIMLGSSILGGALGGGPKIPPMPGLGYEQGTIDFRGPLGTSVVGTGGYAAGANAIGQNVLSLIAQANGTPIADRMYRGTFSSGTTHTWDGKQWVGQNYTQANLLSPTGQVTFIGGTGQNTTPQQAAEALTAQIFRSDVLTGALKGVSDTLVKVFTNFNTYSLQAAKDAVTFSVAYDKLGKAQNTVKDAVDALNQKFLTMSSEAQKYGLSLDPVNAELQKQTTRTAKDFIDGMLDPLAVQMRALDDERKSALASAEYIRDHITGVYVDMDKIAVYYTNKEAALREQFYQGAIGNIENLIRRLTYGDLANASPTTSLAGNRITYGTTLARAKLGISTDIQNLPGIAEAYASTARSYFASSPEYVALIAQIRKDLADVAHVATGGVGASGGPTATQLSQAAAEQNAQIQQLIEVITAQQKDAAVRDQQYAALLAQMRSLVVNRM